MVESREQHIALLRTLSTQRLDTPARNYHRLSLKYLDQADSEIKGLLEKLAFIDTIIGLPAWQIESIRGECNV